MARSAKVAISLPVDILEVIERERTARGETRSEFFRRAVERLLKLERESAAIKDYVRGYNEMPESPEEIAAVHEAGAASLAEEPW